MCSVSSHNSIHWCLFSIQISVYNLCYFDIFHKLCVAEYILTVLPTHLAVVSIHLAAPRLNLCDRHSVKKFKHQSISAMHREMDKTSHLFCVLLVVDCFEQLNLARVEVTFIELGALCTKPLEPD